MPVSLTFTCSLPGPPFLGANVADDMESGEPKGFYRVRERDLWRTYGDYRPLPRFGASGLRNLLTESLRSWTRSRVSISMTADMPIP